MKKQAGFTIVELVVVIALLGILAAVALPRFLNVTDDAHAASNEGTAGALRSAVGLVRARAVVDEVTNGNVTFDGQVIRVNAAGYPQGATGVSTAGCTAVWNAVLQTGAPTINANAGANPAPDYVVVARNNTCIYTYQATAGVSITYTPATGGVVVAAP